jgi:predicted exporter
METEPAGPRRGFGRPHQIFFFLLIAAALAGVFRLKLDVEILNLLPRNNSVAEGLRLYQKYFLNSRELIMTVQSRDPAMADEVSASLAEALRSHSNLVDRVFAEPPWMSSPTAAADLLAFLWLNAPTGKVSELTNQLASGSVGSFLRDNLSKIANSLSPEDMFLAPYDPFSLASIGGKSASMQTPERFFVSSDHTFHILYIQSSQPLDSYKQCENWLAQIRTLSSNVVAEAHLQGKVAVHFTGRPVFVAEIASGMESDMSTTVTGTLAVIGLFFYLSHRRFRPLLLLLATLLVLLGLTALIGAFALGTLNVISIGFAAILLGLAEDFGIVLHQESLSHPEFDIHQLRRAAGPGIFWSAVTSAAAFALLNLSSLPGLRQLGSLIAIGMLLAAWGMLYLFLPLLLKVNRRATPLPENARFRLFHSRKVYRLAISRVATGIILLVSLGLIAWRPPRLDRSPDALRPKQSEASRTLSLLQAQIGSATEPHWLVVEAKGEQEARNTLSALENPLQQAVSNRVISSFNIPLELWPDPVRQKQNAARLAALAQDESRLERAARKAGFADSALVLNSRVFADWKMLHTGPQWPRGLIAEWLLPKFVARTPNGFLALGLVYPGPDFDEAAFARLLPPNVIISGWGLLGKNIFRHAMTELPWISGAIALIVVLSLWMTFRTGRDVLLSITTLLFSGVVLSACMSVFHWQWNLLNLIAIPLLIGMGVDYSIHIQLALHRYAGDRLKVRQSIGSALLLAGSTTIAGFASLAFSSNYGMATLGKVCALGLTVTLLTAVYILPSWWKPPRRP